MGNWTLLPIQSGKNRSAGFKKKRRVFGVCKTTTRLNAKCEGGGMAEELKTSSLPDSDPPLF